MYSRLTLVSIVLAVLLAGPAFGQSGRTVPATQGAPSDSNVRLEVDEVRLLVKVRDAFGAAAAGLDISNFIVAEDGVRQTLTGFSAEPMPLNIVFLLDASSDVYSELDPVAVRARSTGRDQMSLEDKIFGPPRQPPPIRIDPLADLAATRTLVSHFLDRLRPGDRVSVMQVEKQVELLQDWTEDREAARHAVKWRYKVGFETALWDAVYLAAEEQLSKVEGQRVLVIVGDGVDTASKLTNQQATAALDRWGVTTYVVSTSDVARKRAERYLDAELGPLAPRRALAKRSIQRLGLAAEETRAMTERSGGVFYEVATADDAKAIPVRFLEELQYTYLLSYVSSNESKAVGWRSVAVYTDRPGVKATTRRGYLK